MEAYGCRNELFEVYLGLKVLSTLAEIMVQIYSLMFLFYIYFLSPPLLCGHFPSQSKRPNQQYSLEDVAVTRNPKSYGGREHGFTLTKEDKHWLHICCKSHITPSICL